MADSLADRLKRMAQEESQGQKAETDQRTLQERVNSFISQNALPEFNRLKAQIAKRLEELNPEIGDLPKFRLIGDAIQQDNCVAYLLFDKPITNMPNNQLFITIGPHQNALYFFSAPPESRRFRLHAAATNELDGIVWAGDLGEVTSVRLTEVIFETLTSYYLKNKPGSRG